jgi:hypothetical protein
MNKGPTAGKNRQSVVIRGTDRFQRTLQVTVLKIHSGKVRLGLVSMRLFQLIAWKCWNGFQGETTHF